MSILWKQARKAFLCLIIAQVLVGCTVNAIQPPAQTPDPEQPAATYDPTNFNSHWVAYHNCMAASGNTNNTTANTANDSVTTLRNFSDNSVLAATVRLNYTNVANWTSGGSFVASNDVYMTFDGILNLQNNASYSDGVSDTWVEVTISNLDPAKKYMFVTTGNRNSIAYLGSGSSSRWTKFSIIGADSYTSFSSAGATRVSDAVVKINTGYNNTNGHVAAWTDIVASDGVFTIRSENVGAEGPGEAYKSYGLIGFKLVELSN